MEKKKQAAMSEAQKLFIPYVFGTLILLISLCFGMKSAGIGLLIWLLILVWTLKKSLFAQITPKELVQTNERKLEESLQQKKYVQSSMHLLAMPMVAIGIAWVIVTVGMMIFIF